LPYPICPVGFQGSQHDVGTFLIHKRRRYYDCNLNRWLTRDPKGYADGMNLYQGFGSNPASFMDPMGTEIWVESHRTKSSYQGAPVWRVDYKLNRDGWDIDWLASAFSLGRAVETQMVATQYFPYSQDLRYLRTLDIGIENDRQIIEEAAIADRAIQDYSTSIKTGIAIAVALPVAAATAPAAGAVFSTTTIGITETTVAGNVAAGVLTGSVSLGAGAATSEAVFGGTPREVAEAGLQGGVIGGFTGGAVGLVAPVGAFSGLSSQLSTVSTPRWEPPAPIVGESPGSGAIRVRGQIPYRGSDLSGLAAEFRQGAGISAERNIAVIEFRTPNGLNTITVASGRGVGHAERLAGARVEELGIAPANVTRVYSELEPCSLPGGYCRSYLQSTFHAADVTWSFEYGATPTSRQAGMRALERAAEASRGQLYLFEDQ